MLEAFPPVQPFLGQGVLAFTGRVPGIAFGDLRGAHARERIHRGVGDAHHGPVRRMLHPPLLPPVGQILGPAMERIAEPASIRYRPHGTGFRLFHRHLQLEEHGTHCHTPRLVLQPVTQLIGLPRPIVRPGLRSQLPHHVGMLLELRQLIQLGQRQLREPLRPGTHLGRDARDPQPATHERLTAPRLRRQLTHVRTQVEQTLIPVSLLQRRQIGTLAILHQHQLTLRASVHLAHNTRHPLNASQLARRQTTMTNHHTKQALAVFLVVGGDHERLLQPLFLDAVGQLGDVAHVLAGIVRVEDEVLYVDIDDVDSH